MRWTLLFFALLTGLVVQAETTSPLTCSVTETPTGFLYRLSDQPSSSSPTCETCWEKENKTVIARMSEFSQVLVQNLTKDSIILTVCLDYLHYTRDCEGVFWETDCRVNCSLLSQDQPQVTVNTTLICFSQFWCLNQLTFGCLITGFILLLCCIFTVPMLVRRCRRRRRAAERRYYAPATQQIKEGECEGVGKDYDTTTV